MGPVQWRTSRSNAGPTSPSAVPCRPPWRGLEWSHLGFGGAGAGPTSLTMGKPRLCRPFFEGQTPSTPDRDSRFPLTVQSDSENFSTARGPAPLNPMIPYVCCCHARHRGMLRAWLGLIWAFVTRSEGLARQLVYRSRETGAVSVSPRGLDSAENFSLRGPGSRASSQTRTARATGGC